MSLKIFASKTKPETIALFFRQFCTLIKTGIPIVRTLDILMQQAEDEEFRKELKLILYEISQKGVRLYRAFMKHPHVFSPVHVYMIKAGEESGTLPEVLDQIATYQEKNLNFQKKIKASLMYPFAVTLASFIVIFILIRFVLPIIISTVSGMPDQKLPLPTKIVFNLAKTAQNPFVFLITILLITVSSVLFFNYIKTPLGKIRWDTFKIKFPLIGPMLLKIFIIRFCTTLNVLYGSGISIINSLQSAARAGGNEYIQERVEKGIIERVKGGENIYRTFHDLRIFPPMLIYMLQAGEETGKIEKMTKKATQMYELDVELGLSQMTALLEPVLIVIMGLVVTVIVLSAIMPIYQLMQGL